MDTIFLNDTPLPGYDHRIITQDQIERKDASGETSSGLQSHQGWKAAILTITLKIRDGDESALRTLRTMWQLKAEDGTPLVRTITHPLTDSLDIKEVRFTDFLNISPPEKKKRWDVVFNMMEVRSVQAKKEEREEVPATEEPGGVTDTGDVATTTSTGESTGQVAPDSVFEKFLVLLEEGAGKLFKWFTQ